MNGQMGQRPPQAITTSQAFRDLRAPSKPMGAGWVAFMLSNAVQKRLVCYPLPGSKGRVNVESGPVHLIHQNLADLITQARTVVQGSSLKVVTHVPSPYFVAPPAPFVAADFAGAILQNVFGAIVHVTWRHYGNKKPIKLTADYGPYTGALARKYNIFPKCEEFSIMILAVADNQGLGQISAANPMRIGIIRTENPGVVFADGMAPGEIAPALPPGPPGSTVVIYGDRDLTLSLESLNLRDIGAA